MNYIYIYKNIPERYIILEEELNSELYSNLGTTYEDYLNGDFVLLSEKQVQFHNDYPEASVKEVFYTHIEEPFIPERTLEDAKLEKILEIDNYDNSEAVNSFLINDMIPAWFSVQDRLNYGKSVESAKLLGINSLQFFVGDVMLEIETLKAEQLLAALQLYADTCFIVTKKHKLAVEGLESIEEVDEYDYTAGYPKKLNFELS